MSSKDELQTTAIDDQPQTSPESPPAESDANTVTGDESRTDQESIAPSGSSTSSTTCSSDPDTNTVTMPVRVECAPPPPANSKQLGVQSSLLYNGSKFKGSQKSKGNSYDVEVVLQVSDHGMADHSSR